MSDLSALTDREILKRWDGEGGEGEDLDEGADIDDIGNLFERRDEILEELKERGLFPGNFMKQWENDTGAYPTIEDPEFLQKLLAKREFAESLQTTWEPENDPCGDTNAFEVTPVQRFAANLMSPRTPYMSALLFHGVGVGKTCAAVQIAEAWLGTYARDKIFLVAVERGLGGGGALQGQHVARGGAVHVQQQGSDQGAGCEGGGGASWQGGAAGTQGQCAQRGLREASGTTKTQKNGFFHWCF
jgi:hypothetical protein